MNTRTARTATGVATWWGTRVVGVLACVFLIAPILVFLPLSLNSGSFFHFPLQGISLRWYDDLFTSPFWFRALINSLVVGGLATALSLLLGLPAAFGLWRANFSGKSLLAGLFIAPMVVPAIITGVSVYYAYAQVGLTGSYLGLVLSHTALAVPFVVITVTASLSGFNPDYLRAGASLGASPLVVFFRVTLPLVMPGVVSGALFAFATSFDDVVVALFMAGPEQRTLPRQMLTASVDGFRLTITAAGSLMVVISLLLLLVVQALRRRSQRLTGHDES
jgi:putative spermidine/putrescine transport system permease protein